MMPTVIIVPIVMTTIPAVIMHDAAGQNEWGDQKDYREQQNDDSFCSAHLRSIGYVHDF
jgi:hypothetical protein